MGKFHVVYFGSNDVPVDLITPILKEIDADMTIRRPTTDAEVVEMGSDADGIIMHGSVPPARARRDARRPDRLRRRPHRAQVLVAARRPRRAQARRDRSAVALRPGAAEDARLDQHHAEHLADGGGDRLAEHPAAASTAFPDRARRLDEAQQILRARLTYAGTTLRFSTEEDDFWWWLMDSADANAARLILAVLDDPAWKDDLPRMVVGSLARQRDGAWLTTTANLWGSLALDKFSAKFESAPVAGTTSAALSFAAHRRAGCGVGVGAAHGRRLVAAGERRCDRGCGGRRRAATLNVVQEGSGKPWLTVQSLAAIPLKAPLARRLSRHAQRQRGRAEGQGRPGRAATSSSVRLEIDAQSDMTWVVVSDPVPGGATILGGGLGRDSQIATRGEQRAGSAWPAYEERSFEAFRSYYEYLPRGKHVIEYTRAPEQPGPVRAAADARRGDVRAGELRRDAERARSRSRREAAGARRPARAAPLALRRACAHALPTFAEVKAAHRPSDVTLVDRHGTPIQTVRVDKAVRRLAVDAARRDVAGAADGDRPERGPALLGARRRRLAGGGARAPGATSGTRARAAPRR